MFELYVTIVFVINKKIKSLIYAIIVTIIITLFFIKNINYHYYKVKESVKNNLFNNVSYSELIYDFLLIIFNSIMIILFWLFLFMQFNYQIFYINLLYLLLALILGTNIILYLLYHNYITGVNYNEKSYYINPTIVSGIITDVGHKDKDNKRPIITFEYTVNNVKYINTSNEYNLIYTNYKKNDKIQIIYSSDSNPQYSSIYNKTITYYSWIYIILLVITLILLWLFFIYDIYNISL